MTSLELTPEGFAVGRPTLVGASARHAVALSARSPANRFEIPKVEIIHTLELKLSECGTNINHNNCVVEAIELPLLQLLKTGLDHGVLTALNGQLQVECINVTIFNINFTCLYDLTGMELLMKEQHSTAFQVPLRLIEGTAFCPEEVFEDQLLEMTTESFVLE